MEDNKRIEIKNHLVEDWDKFAYKNELAADVKMKYIFGPYGKDEHFNIDDIWAIAQEVEAEKSADYVPPVVESVPPTDSEVLDKLIADNVVTQEEVDAAIEKLIPDAVIEEQPVSEESVKEESPIVEESVNPK